MDSGGNVKATVAFREGVAIGVVQKQRKLPPPPASEVPEPCPKCGAALIRLDQGRTLFCPLNQDIWTWWQYQRLVRAIGEQKPVSRPGPPPGPPSTGKLRALRS